MAHRAASAAYAALFEELMSGPTTVGEMVAASGMHENTVRKFVAAMYRRKCLRVVGMDKARDGRLKVKVHALKGYERRDHKSPEALQLASERH